MEPTLTEGPDLVAKRIPQAVANAEESANSFRPSLHTAGPKLQGVLRSALRFTYRI